MVVYLCARCQSSRDTNIFVMALTSNGASIPPHLPTGLGAPFKLKHRSEQCGSGAGLQLCLTAVDPGTCVVFEAAACTQPAPLHSFLCELMLFRMDEISWTKMELGRSRISVAF